jgi:hypothetical protein
MLQRTDFRMTLAQQVLDFDAYFMDKAFSLIDFQIERVAKFMKEDFDAEGDSSLVDDYEFLHAIGFVAAQKYLTSSCKVLGMEKEKRQAFAVGQKVNADVSCAALVNAAANHFKHCDEWDFENPSELAQPTIDTLKKAGVNVPQFGASVACDVFGKLGLEKLRDLTPILKQWSVDIETAFPNRR